VIHVAIALVLVAVACSSDAGPPVGQTGSGGSGSSFALRRENMPDDSWNEAALVVGKHWHESFTQLGVQRASIQPFAAPDRSLVPFMFRIQADKDGKPVFRSTALLWNNQLLNTAAPARVSAFLASLGFPGKQIHVGHLVEILHITKTIDASWLRPPSTHGWDLDKAATLTYADGKATLTLVRANNSAEQNVVTFAADATFTQSEPAKPK
jgi:hypothetical protein